MNIRGSLKLLKETVTTLKALVARCPDEPNIVTVAKGVLASSMGNEDVAKILKRTSRIDDYQIDYGIRASK